MGKHYCCARRCEYRGLRLRLNKKKKNDDDNSSGDSSSGIGCPDALAFEDDNDCIGGGGVGRPEAWLWRNLMMGVVLAASVAQTHLELFAGSRECPRGWETGGGW